MLRLAGNLSFRDALRAAGVQAEVIRADPPTYAGVNEAVGKAGDTITTPPLMSFLLECVA